MRKELDTALSGAGVEPASDTQALFNRQLATYRKVTRENLMNHREVYGLLKEIVLAEAPQRFSFLDVACGDASASAAMLQGTSIDHYYGIDLSRPSLDLAAATLTSLPCKVDLYCRNFVDALAEWNVPVDVVWIGMSLHHLQPREKQRFMVDVHSALANSGVFLIWEPTLLDGEDRAGWLARFSTFRPQWAALSSEEFADMESHMRAADFPEAADDWKTMGIRAGFRQASEIYAMPNRMGRVFKFLN
jgi:SAM-dependent methyltransferase